MKKQKKCANGTSCHLNKNLFNNRFFNFIIINSPIRTVLNAIVLIKCAYCMNTGENEI
jgi:hypothetical protein